MMVREMLTRDFSYDLSWSAMIQRPEFDISALDDNAIDAIWLYKWAEHFLARLIKPT